MYGYCHVGNIGRPSERRSSHSVNGCPSKKINLFLPHFYIQRYMVPTWGKCMIAVGYSWIPTNVGQANEYTETNHEWHVFPLSLSYSCDLQWTFLFKYPRSREFRLNIGDCYGIINAACFCHHHQSYWCIHGLNGNVMRGTWVCMTKCYFGISSPKTYHKASLIARLMGPTWGPPGADKTQARPMMAPWALLSGITFDEAEANGVLEYIQS